MFFRGNIYYVKIKHIGEYDFSKNDFIDPETSILGTLEDISGRGRHLVPHNGFGGDVYEGFSNQYGGSYSSLDDVWSNEFNAYATYAQMPEKLVSYNEDSTDYTATTGKSKIMEWESVANGDIVLSTQGSKTASQRSLALKLWLWIVTGKQIPIP